MCDHAHLAGHDPKTPLASSLYADLLPEGQEAVYEMAAFLEKRLV